MKTVFWKRLSPRVISTAGAFLLAAALLVLGLISCKTLDTVTSVGTAIGVATGTIDETQAASIQKSQQALARTFQDITPEQEYYIGRTVGAVVVNKYRPFDDASANRYLNLIGQTLAQASDMPETFGGYHFLILDSDEINAFAASGGLIFITRGLLRCCKNEDAVAAVLAHEIGHIQAKHGLQAIKQSRVTSALTTLALEGAKTMGGQDLATLTSTFEGSISDITTTMIQNGYSRSFERQADMAALTILQRVGYSPGALVAMLSVMQQRLKPGGLDFAKTHPSPQSRITDIENRIGKSSIGTRPAGRQARFIQHLGTI